MIIRTPDGQLKQKILAILMARWILARQERFEKFMAWWEVRS